MEEKLDQHNVQLAQASSFRNFLSHIFSSSDISRVQVTAGKGFEILDEERLQAVIEEM